VSRLLVVAALVALAGCPAGGAGGGGGAEPAEVEIDWPDAAVAPVTARPDAGPE
jgi:hypothetical protein